MSVSTMPKRLLREIKIETKEKSKTLAIYQGDILEDSSDVIGIPVYEKGDDKGEIYKLLQRQSDSYSEKRQLLADNKTGYTSISTSLLDRRHLVYIHLDRKAGEKVERESLQSILKLTFASLTSFLYEGNDIQTVSLPILFRKGIDEENFSYFVSLFIYESAKFLRKNQKIRLLAIYIWHLEDVNSWNIELNEHLILSMDREVSPSSILNLKREIASILQTSLYTTIIPSWLHKKALDQLMNQYVNIKKLASTGNQIVNILVDALCDMPEMPVELRNMNLYKKVRNIKSRRLLVEWLADYLLSVKLFKNYAYDYPVSKSDEFHYLMLLAQILSVCEPILEKGIDHNEKE